MLLERQPGARIFTLDTHVLFPESYALWRAQERYGIRIEVHEGPSLGRQAAIHGEALWERNPDLCCSIRKIAPLAEALSGLDGWITRRYAATRRLPARERRSSAGTTGTSLLGSEPTRRLDRRRRLGLRPQAGPPRESATRPRLRFDRLHALHDAGRRPGRSLGRDRQDGVRPPRMSVTDPIVRLSHLDALESEAIHIMREVAAELERPVLLFSGGKDSIVLLRLAEKAFRPGRFPFPLMHVDTGHN